MASMPKGYHSSYHKHAWGQLTYATTGTMRVKVEGGEFVLPNNNALWIPENHRHLVSTSSGIAFCSLYINTQRQSELPQRAVAWEVTPLLRALIIELANWTENRKLAPQDTRLIEVLIDQLLSAKPAPLFVKTPEDDALKAIFNALMEDIGNTRRLSEWACVLNTSERSLHRKFVQEYEMGFSQWRTQIRMARALELIQSEYSYTQIAMTLGYSSSSAFSYAFHQYFGMAPREYFSSNVGKG